MMTRQLHIEVFFEFICPWCWLGKRQRALIQLQYSELAEVIDGQVFIFMDAGDEHE